MKIDNFGIWLMKITGVIIWSRELKGWKKILIYLHMFHIPFAFIYLTCIHMAALINYFDETTRMLNILWRMAGLVTLFAQVAIIQLNYNKLNALITLSNNSYISNLTQNNIRSKFNKIYYCYLYGIITFMTAYTIRKYFLRDIIIYNANDDVENFIPNLISNQVLAYIVHFHLSFVILQNFTVLFGHDLLLIYVIALAQSYLEHLKESIDVMKLKDDCSRVIRRLVRRGNIESQQGNERYDLKYCITLHQHVIRMVDSINDVYSVSMLLLLWRAFVMSIAAFELAKRVDHFVTGVEVFMFLTITMIQLFTACWVAQEFADQSVSMVDVCLHKAWHGVVTTDPSRVSHVSGERRCLLVMAERFNWPMEFEAGPFYRLSNGTFTSVLGLCFSYFMFFFGFNFRE